MHCSTKNKYRLPPTHLDISVSPPPECILGVNTVFHLSLQVLLETFFTLTYIQLLMFAMCAEMQVGFRVKCLLFMFDFNKK
jgi:hypothetical protein